MRKWWQWRLGRVKQCRTKRSRSRWGRRGRAARKRTKSKSKPKVRFRGRRLYHSPNFWPKVQSPIRVGLRSPSPNSKSDSVLASKFKSKSHPVPQKAPKKPEILFIAFELSTVFCSPCQFFLGPFWGQGVKSKVRFEMDFEVQVQTTSPISARVSKLEVQVQLKVRSELDFEAHKSKPKARFGAAV
jgi:hypothetical protein